MMQVHSYTPRSPRHNTAQGTISEERATQCLLNIQDHCLTSPHKDLEFKHVRPQERVRVNLFAQWRSYMRALSSIASPFQLFDNCAHTFWQVSPHPVWVEVSNTQTFVNIIVIHANASFLLRR